MKFFRAHLKWVAAFLLLIFLQSLIIPSQSYALTAGTAQAEFSTFEPYDTSDMVNLATGDFTYSLPLIHVPSPEGGYPLALSYHAGIRPEQVSGWVGLGWNINPGAITRGVNGLPDDWDESDLNIYTYDDGETYTSWSVSLDFSPTQGAVSGGFTVSHDSETGFGGSVNIGMSLTNTIGLSGSYGTDGMSMGLGYSKVLGPLVGSAGLSWGTGGLGFGGGISLNPKFVVRTMQSTQSLEGMKANAKLNKTIGRLASRGFSIGMGLSSQGASAFSSTPFGTMSVGSGASSGDVQTQKINFFVPIPIPVKAGLIWATFRYNYFKWWLFKHDEKKAFGSLYTTDGSILGTNIVNDVYENNGASLPAFDAYRVTAQGVSGSMRPRHLEMGTVMGESQVLDYHTGDDDDKFRTTLTYLDETNFDFSKNPEDIHYYFDHDPSGYLKHHPGTLTGSLSLVNGYFASPSISSTGAIKSTQNALGQSYYNASSDRMGQGRHIEWFTNEMIHDANLGLTSGQKVWNAGFIEDPIMETKRGDVDEVEAKGVGGFVVTAQDGKQYHFSIPVYNFEQVRVAEDKTDPASKYFESNQYKKFAHTWLLTAVTGPDYVDRNGDHKVDAGDWGYWVKFKYGNYTDYYGWANPYDYQNAPGTQNSRQYSFGRKEVYYLDAVETRTHTAYFLKKEKEDERSVEIMRTLNHISKIKRANRVDFGSGDYPFDLCQNQNGNVNFPPVTINSSSTLRHRIKAIERDMELSLPLVKMLKLDKVILVRNEDIQLTGSEAPFTPVYGNAILSDNLRKKVETTSSVVNTGIWFDQGFICENHTSWSNSKNTGAGFVRNDHVIETDDLASWEATNGAAAPYILEEIEFDQDYSLCPETPNSRINPNDPNKRDGKLTLNAVKFHGKGGAFVMPSYQFDYNQAVLNPAYNENSSDAWGFYGGADDNHPKPNVAAWSLAKIYFPEGGEMSIEYESDSYHREAATERITALEIIDAARNGNSTRFEIICDDQSIDFTDWFTVGNSYPIKMFIIGNHQSPQSVTCGDHLNSEADFIGDFTLHSKYINGSGETVLVFDPDASIGACHYQALDANTVHAAGMIKSSDGIQYGGGLRVKSIAVGDGTGNNYVTRYDYNHPFENDGETSGVTSYSPVGKAIVPYAHDVPGPSVMYEYVTSWTEAVNGELGPKTRYHFQVLPQLETAGSSGLTNNEVQMGNLFWVEDIQGTSPGAPQSTLNRPAMCPTCKSELFLRSTVMHNNLAALGRLIDMETFDTYGDKISHYEAVFYDPSEANVGVFQESYHTTKQIRHYDTDLKYSEEFYSTNTSRQYYPNQPKGTISSASVGESYTRVENYDLVTGQPQTSYSQNKLNEVYKSEGSYAAPRGTVGPWNPNAKYADMGSKLFDISNKNMLTQGDYQKTSIATTSTPLDQITDFSTLNWKTLGASASTWNDTWDYREFVSPNSFQYVSGTDPVWRIESSYIWKGFLNDDGTYDNTFQDFDPANPTSNGWERISKVTHYDHYSNVMEATYPFDLYPKFSSTKFGNAQNNLPIASASSGKYTEMAFSGAENVDLSTGYNLAEVDHGGATVYSTPNIGPANPDFFDPNVHTGLHSMQISSPGQKAFVYTASASSSNPEMIKGKLYRASVWVKREASNLMTNYVKLYYKENGTEKVSVTDMNPEFVAGDWILLNLDFEPSPSAGNVEIGLSCEKAVSGVYVDDFRVHPMVSSFTSIVYDPYTSEPVATLDNDNIARKYVYDAAGRIIKSYQETHNGFRLTSEKAFNFKKPLE